LIHRDLGVEPAVNEGARGEFTIRVGDDIVARKDSRGFPDEQDVLDAVRRALGR
jgi:predicted Rdx family selenoprotein